MHVFCLTGFNLYGIILMLPYLFPATGKEVHTLETTVSLICSIAANVISYYICKWLEGQK